MRCREILRKLTRTPSEPDPLHARMSITQLIDEAAGPYRGFDADIVVTARPEDGEAPTPRSRWASVGPASSTGSATWSRTPSISPATRWRSSAAWSAREVTITIADDGQGIPPDVMDALGEPYITTRPSRSGETGQDGEASGLGLGFFIAKTLLERSGATVSLENRELPATGAVARVSWPREAFVNQQAAAQAFVERRAEALGASLETAASVN